MPTNDEIINCIKQQLHANPALGATVKSIEIDSNGVVHLTFISDNGSAVGDEVSNLLCNCEGVGQYSVSGEDPPVGGSSGNQTYSNSSSCSGSQQD